MVLYGLVRIKQHYSLPANLESREAKNFKPFQTNKTRVVALLIDGLVISSLAGTGIFFLVNGHFGLGGGLLGGSVVLIGFDVIAKMKKDASDCAFALSVSKQQPNQPLEIQHISRNENDPTEKLKEELRQANKTIEELNNQLIEANKKNNTPVPESVDNSIIQIYEKEVFENGKQINEFNKQLQEKNEQIQQLELALCQVTIEKRLLIIACTSMKLQLKSNENTNQLNQNQNKYKVLWENNKLLEIKVLNEKLEHVTRAYNELAEHYKKLGAEKCNLDKQNNILLRNNHWLSDKLETCIMLLNEKDHNNQSVQKQETLNTDF